MLLLLLSSSEWRMLLVASLMEIDRTSSLHNWIDRRLIDWLIDWLIGASKHKQAGWGPRCEQHSDTKKMASRSMIDERGRVARVFEPCWIVSVENALGAILYCGLQWRNQTLSWVNTLSCISIDQSINRRSNVHMCKQWRMNHRAASPNCPCSQYSLLYLDWSINK